MNKTKWLLLMWVLLTLGATLVVGLHLFLGRKEVNKKIIEEEGIYRIGGITVDTEKGQIQFQAKIFKDKGWVQHLVYLEGYKWLKEESAIISEARLSDLQKAIALLDWRLWDELWYGKTENRRQRTENRKLLVSVKRNGEEVAAQKLVLTEDKLEIGDFIFLGSPYFDHIALEAPPGVDCRLCPIFPLEEKALGELFIRGSGRLGYELNSALFPPEGTKVTIIIRLSK